jgi:hydroxymethylpyrimidine/phosphomethylpyrimidine kinase
VIPRILTIAGSDSGGGAGIQADIKTITMLGGHALTAITAITAQNTLGVTDVMPVPADIVVAQIDAVISDIGVDAIKIGMIGSPEVAGAVADTLAALFQGREIVPIVFDPVMIASSGAVLADAATVAAFSRLMGLSVLVTPNLPELAALAGAEELEDEGAQVAAAIGLVRDHQAAFLVKGGHAPGVTVVDRLVGWNGTVAEWSGERGIRMALAARCPARSRQGWARDWSRKRRSRGRASMSAARSRRRRDWARGMGRWGMALGANISGAGRRCGFESGRLDHGRVG